MSYCYATQTPVFSQPMRLIRSVTKAPSAFVTTTFDHGYATGLIVRFHIPQACGMTQLDKQYGVITVISSTSFIINIDSSFYDTFIYWDPAVDPSAPNKHHDTCAQVIPIGEINSTLALAVQQIP